MKKFMRLFCLVLCSALTVSIASCNSDSQTNPVADKTIDSAAKTLVVYFSMPDNKDNSSVEIDGETLGNTQYMAYVIQENTGGDIFRIEPEIPYTTDHDKLVELADKEKQEKARPKIKDIIENFDSYDTVFVGYPNWWADMPMILYTFFDTYDFSDKTIITFNTHGGSGFSGTNKTIAELEPNADVIEGLSISRNNIENAEREIADWVKDLGYGS